MTQSIPAEDARWPAFAGWWWALVPLLLAMVLGMPRLATDNLWHDEVWSLKAVGGDPYPRRNPGEIARFLTDVDPVHPPGYFLLLAGWGPVAGWTPFAGRMLSVWGGTLTVAMVYRLGSTLFARRVGFYAACVIASSAFLVYFMHELRAYTLLMFWTAWVLWAYCRVMDATHRPPMRVWLGLFGGISALLYTNYMGMVPLVAVGVWHLTRRPRTRVWWQTSLISGAAAATFYPWVAVVRTAFDYFSRMRLPAPALTPGEMLVHIGTALGNGDWLLPVIPLLVALIVAGRAGRNLWFMLIVMGLAYCVINWRTGVLTPPRLRYFAPLWPVLAVLVGVGIARLPRRLFISELLLIGWVAVGIEHSRDNGFAQALEIDGWWSVDWQTMTSAVADNEQPGDAFIVLSGWRTDAIAFEYYSYALDSPAAFSYPPKSAERILALAEVAQRLWIGYDAPPGTEPGTPLHHRVWTDYALCGSYFAGPNFMLNLHVRPPTEPLARFGTGILPPRKELQLDLVTPLPAVSADELTVDLIWAADLGITDDTYTAVLALVDERGAVVAEESVILPGARQTCTHHVVDLAGVAAGTYQFQVAVLTGNTLLPGVVRGTGDPVERVSLGNVVVAD